MDHRSPSIQELSKSRRCAVQIGFSTADIVYSICDHLTLGEAAVLAFVSSSLMDILRGKLMKLNTQDNLEHSRYAMQRLRFFDHKMPGKYWCMPCDQYHLWDKRFCNFLHSNLLYSEESHPDPARDIRVHTSAKIAAPNIQLLKRARYYGKPEYGIRTWTWVPSRYSELGEFIDGESLADYHRVNASWRGGRGMILCIESNANVAVKLLEASTALAESQCAEALALLICMCENEPRYKLEHRCQADSPRELSRARVIQSLAGFLCSCHNDELANDIYKDCMDALQILRVYRKSWWDGCELPRWKSWSWRRCSPGCNMLVRVRLAKNMGRIGLIRYHDLGPDFTFNGGTAQNVSSLYRVTPKGSCEYRGWHNEHDRFEGRNWKDIVIPILSKLGGIGWVDQRSQRQSKPAYSHRTTV